MPTNRHGPAWVRTQLRAGLSATQMRFSSVPYISAEIGPAILIGAALIGDSGFRCLPDHGLENLNTAREVIAIHYERRKNAKSVLSGGEREQTTFPAAFYDVVR